MESPTRERLAELLNYDPETGGFTWAKTVNHRCPEGSKAGHVDKDGYLIIGVDYRPRRAHRLAFIIMTGEPPKHEVDHIDGCRTNNAWSNLRDASRALNCQNTRRRPRKHNLPRGVMPRKNKFSASIMLRGKYIHLGLFDTPDAASQAYVAAKRRLHEGFIQSDR